MSTTDIISTLARERVVEGLCLNVAHVSVLSADLKDLAQIVYVILLEYEPGKVAEMYREGTLRFFVARIICNQYRSSSSPFHKVFRDFRSRCSDIDAATNGPASYQAHSGSRVTEDAERGF